MDNREIRDLYDIVWQEVINGAFNAFDYLGDFYRWFDEFVEEQEYTSQYDVDELDEVKRLVKEELVEQFDLEEEFVEDEEEEYYREDFEGPSAIY